VYVKSSFTVINLPTRLVEQLPSLAYGPMIWHVYRTCMKSEGQRGGKPKFWGPWPPHTPRTDDAVSFIG